MKTTILILIPIFLFSCNQTKFEQPSNSNSGEQTELKNKNTSGLEKQYPNKTNDANDQTDSKSARKDKISTTDVFINSIDDIHKLKNRGSGISTYGVTNPNYEVLNPLKKFGQYFLFDTTHTKNEYLGILEIMTNAKYLTYESNDEKVVAFKTTNAKLVFSENLRIGKSFDDSNMEISKTINDTTFQFKLKEMDYIVTLGGNKKISSITVGVFESKKPAYNTR